MWLDRVANPGPLAHESDTLLTALRGPALDSFDTFTVDRFDQTFIVCHSHPTK